jgi:hypothetical protein
MPVSDPSVIDLVAHDPKTDVVTLIMVEAREWGDRGMLLPDLQSKLSTYLGYALDGALLQDYPDLEGKAIAFQLSYAYPPGPRERDLIDIVRRKYLEPEGIQWREASIPAA